MFVSVLVTLLFALRLTGGGEMDGSLSSAAGRFEQEGIMASLARADVLRRAWLAVLRLW